MTYWCKPIFFNIDQEAIKKRYSDILQSEEFTRKTLERNIYISGLLDNERIINRTDMLTLKCKNSYIKYNRIITHYYKHKIKKKNPVNKKITIKYKIIDI